MIVLCFMIVLIFSAGAVFLYKKSSRAKTFTKTCAIAFGAIVILIVGLELSLFNINFYTTRKNQPTDLTPYIEKYKTPDGYYTFSGGDEIEIADLNEEISNIHLGAVESSYGYVNIRLQLTDEANQYYFGNPKRTIYPRVEKSHYVNVHTSGKSEQLKIVIEEDPSMTFKATTLEANSKRPFEFSFLRLFILSCGLFFLYLFRPRSPLYDRKLKNNQLLTSNLKFAFIAIQCALIVFVGTMNPTFLGFDVNEDGLYLSTLPMDHHNQYDDLAQAVLQGKTYIDNDDVPQSLIDMENPYDTYARQVMQETTGDVYKWDVAYFNGHYYVYFGIVPLLLMYLPCRLLFDAPFPSAVGIMIFASIFAIGVFAMLELIAKKRFRNISVGTYFLTAITFVNCCGAMFLVKRPDFYSVPIITAMAFIVWGLYCWLKAQDEEKKQKLYYLLGSLFFALSVGCRPQMVLVSAVALPLFFKKFFTEKQILNKKGITDLITLAIPFVIVAAGIMYYNYIRFGSVTDFGSSYNLTTNDVTRRGFDIGRTGLGLFTYLFQPPQFTATFPYIEAVSINTNYVGKTIYELCFGGLITTLPVLWFIFALPKVKEKLKDSNLFAFVITLLGIGIALVIADTQAGGLLQRYYSDFGFIFFLAATIVIFAIFDKKDLKKSNINLHSFLFISTILSIVYTIALVFSVADVTINTENPTLYGTLMHLVEFWL